MSWADTHPRVSPLRAGLRCRCPRCGEGRLYDGLMRVAGRCGACGLDLRRADSGDGPAVFVILILGALVVLSALLLESRAAPPLWVHAALWPGVILAGAVAMLRPAKALLIALQFRTKAEDPGAPDHDAPA